MIDRPPGTRLPSPPETIARIAVPLPGGPRDFDEALDLIGKARIVMLGEATHGTAEFYALRARLTRRLIEEKGFDFVAIEGDWPDAAQINRYVRGGPGSAAEALAGFKRFPAWMWRNTVVLPFVQWLRDFNDAHARGVGFYGLDLYSLHASMKAVLRFLSGVDPEAAAEARKRFACFEPFGEDTRKYAMSSHFLSKTCEEEVVDTLVDLLTSRQRYLDRTTPEEMFDTELNGIAVVNSERYYRKLVQGGAVTWNLRDRHMVATLRRLLDHVGPNSKAVLWEHNSHIGDFRATEDRGAHVNVGQLVRQRYGRDAIAIGFGTHRGTVTAASAWDGPAEFKRVPSAQAGSYEAIFHETGLPAFFMRTAGISHRSPEGWLHDVHGERAIGVVYNPENELGNYVPSRLARRYDGYFFVDETLAVEPLDPPREPPGLETYPTGL